MPSFADLGIAHPGVFCAAVLLLNFTPGPDTALIVGRSVLHGRRAGLLSVLGISAGCAVHTIALALGLSALIAASTGAYTAIKVAGAGYLVVLGVRMILGTFARRGPAPMGAAATPAIAVGVPADALRTVMQGFATNILNPKVVLFFLSFFPQFVSSTSGSTAQAFLILGALMTVISTAYNAGVAWLAGGVAQRMQGAPRVKKWLDRSIGAAFVALGARIAFADR